MLGENNFTNFVQYTPQNEESLTNTLTKLGCTQYFACYMCNFLAEDLVNLADGAYKSWIYFVTIFSLPLDLVTNEVAFVIGFFH